VLRVRAPWVKDYYNVDGKFYIIPQVDSVVLGGTTQADDWDERPREADSQHVLRGCCQVLPSLARAEVVQAWAGLRPARSRVRLELDGSADWGGLLEGPLGLRAAPPVIHNYGHGGAGVTLHWGCARDVAALAAGVLAARGGGGGGGRE
jgi:glycine/D-amino acid oxidase-like deaminating enzyme